MRFLAALSFLTSIPLPWLRDINPEEVGRSTIYFPVVGAIIGLILAGLNGLFALFLPQTVVNGLLLVSLIVISGALHIDGFIDTCDGIAGHKSVEDRWEVMHDSRAGAFGIVGVVLLLLVKLILLNYIPERSLMGTLVLMTVASRWAMVYAIFGYTYARPSGLGMAFKQWTSWQGFIVATIITLAVAIGLTRWANIDYFYLAGPALIIIIWLVVMLMAAYFKRKFSGLTGDTYGAINEVIEVFVLLVICALAYNRWLI